MEKSFANEAVVAKWKELLEHADLPKIADSHRKNTVAQLLENQHDAIRELNETTPANFSNDLPGTSSGNIAKWDPILISLVRRTMPNLMAYDICGVQPMSGPVGLIFCMKSRYNNQTGGEALFQEPDTAFSGKTGGSYSGVGATDGGGYAVGPATDPFASAFSTTALGVTFGGGMSTLVGEGLGVPSSTDPFANDQFAQMAFSIEKSTVTAKTRALKGEYSMEVSQDMKAIHGLDAETELANMISAELLAEINRELVRTIYNGAKLGCRSGVTQTQGVFDLNTDSNGRWSAEKFKGLLFHIERECNQIGKETRRGKGNFIICTSDVASALSMIGVLDYTPALQGNLQVDDNGNTFAGTINGKIKVYIDPYSSMNVAYDFVCAGYKGANPMDAGLFYCPYVPLQMVRAVGENSFQPKIGFKTRYGMVNNPFVTLADGTPSSDPQTAIRRNMYYRIFKVTNLM